MVHPVFYFSNFSEERFPIERRNWVRLSIFYFLHQYLFFLIFYFYTSLLQKINYPSNLIYLFSSYNPLVAIYYALNYYKLS